MGILVEKENHLGEETSKELYRALVRCRKFDEKIVELYPQQEIRCPIHLSIGQEAVASGVCCALKNDDLLFSTHRCHSHTIAKGGNFKLMMAELYGKETGCSKGKGGSMHFVQNEIGMMGSSAIVGGTIPLAVGAALAMKMQEKDVVSIAFFGDGAIEQGAFHESMNFASLKKLPIIFVCENNFYATCSHVSARQPYSDLYRRAAGYLIPAVQVDGTKVQEVYFAAEKAVRRAREGGGATFIEAICYRWKEHVGPNFDYSLGYRSKEELDEWIKRCPLKLFEEFVMKNSLISQADLTKISQEVIAELEEAVTFAKKSPFPQTQALYEDL